MKNLIVEPGMMLYNPHRNSLGWVVDQKEVTNIIGWYMNYVVQWANDPRLDNLTINNINSYHQSYLDLEKQHGL